MPSSHASPPPWAFELPPRLGEWAWQPPTSPEDRKHRRGKFSISRLLDDAISRLESLGEEEPWSRPPHLFVDAAESPAMAPKVDETAIPRRQAPEASMAGVLDVPAEPRATAKRPKIISDMVDTLQFNICRLKSPDRKQLEDVCGVFRRDVELLIRRNAASPQHLLSALDPFNDQIRSLVTEEGLLDNIRAVIGSRIIREIVQHRIDGQDAYGPDFWLSFVEQSCAMTPQAKTFELFKHLMDAIPRSSLNAIEPDLIFSMAKAFVAFAAAKPWHERRHATRSRLHFAGALRRITPKQHAHLQEKMSVYLQNLTRPAKPGRARFQWTLAMAHDRKVPTDVFLDAAMESNGAKEWAPDKAFALLKGRLWAGRYIKPDSVDTFLFTKPDANGLRMVVSSVYHSPKRDLGLKELCRVSKRLGYFDTLFNVLISGMSNRLDMLRALAIAMDDHRLAHRLWSALLSKNPASGDSEVWNWTAWCVYTEQIIKDPHLDSGHIWRVLELERTRENEPDPATAMGDITSKAQLLERMATWFLETPHLTDRQVLRNIEKCIALYLQFRKPVSEELLVNLSQVVTRDLERGQFGRTSRLDYLVALTDRNLGHENAEKVLVLIRGWRWAIVNRMAQQGHAQRGSVEDGETEQQAYDEVYETGRSDDVDERTIGDLTCTSQTRDTQENGDVFEQCMAGRRL